jgi:hypothetical protein
VTQQQEVLQRVLAGVIPPGMCVCALKYVLWVAEPLNKHADGCSAMLAFLQKQAGRSRLVVWWGSR